MSLPERSADGAFLSTGSVVFLPEGQGIILVVTIVVTRIQAALFLLERPEPIHKSR